MIIFTGTQFYGKVDRVPGLCYVVTRFFHVWFIPLIPLQSYLTLEMGASRLPIPLSGKSVFAGWMRIPCMVVLVLSSLPALVGLLDFQRNPDAKDVLLVGGSLVLISGALFGLSHVWSKASPRRAVQLGAHLGIAEVTMSDLVTPKDQRLKDLEDYRAANPDALDTGRRRGGGDEDDGDGRRDRSTRKDRWE
jgi:hypothetical protein